MALVYLDRAMELSRTEGSGAYDLDGAVIGYQAFTDVGDGNTCYYAATDGRSWEVGLGTYVLASSRLIRTSVLDGSNGTSPVNWLAGSKNVWIDYPADAIAAAGTITDVTVATANGFAGATSGGATPELTLSTTVNAPVLKGDGTAIGAATTTGTGSTAVLATSPALITPDLGTPSAAVLTNATGLPLTTGVTGVLPTANGGEANVATRTALSNVDTAKNTVAYLSEAGRQGWFQWNSANLSTQVTADARQGIYVAPASDPSGASGAWVRIFIYAVSPKWWGAVGDGTTDDKLALQDAMSTPYPLYIDTVYATSAALTYSGSGSKQVFGAGNATSQIIGTNASQDIIVKNGAGGLILQNIGIGTNIDKSAGAHVRLGGNGSRDLIDNCMIYGQSGLIAGYLGIEVESDVIPTIRGNYILSMKARAIGLSNPGAGGEATIYGNTFNTSVATPTNAVAIYVASGFNTVVIANNRFQSYGYGVLAQPINGVSFLSLQVTGNVFENTPSASVCANLAAAGTALMQAIEVTGNIFNNTGGGAALRIDSATTPGWIDNINFASNIVRFSTNYPVDIQSGSYFSESGNQYYASSSSLGAIRVGAAIPLGGVCATSRNAFIGSGIIPWTLSGNTNIRTPLNSVPVTKTANFTVTDDSDVYINNKSGSSCTVTLPSAAAYPSRQLTFKNSQAQTVISASSNVVPRVTAAAGTAILASGSGNWCTMESDGTNWVIMAGS